MKVAEVAPCYALFTKLPKPKPVAAGVGSESLIGAADALLPEFTPTLRRTIHPYPLPPIPKIPLDIPSKHPVH